MIKPNFLDACQALQPEDFFVIEGHQITHFEDNSGKGKPTKEAVEAKLKELEANYNAKQYQRDRLAEYPSVQECIHAILDDDLTALQAKRKLVKDKYPKP